MKTTRLIAGGIGSFAVTSAALAGGASFFEDPAAFADALGAAGKVPKGSWALENTQGPSAILGFTSPLNMDFPGPYDPGAMLDNLTFQSNLDPFGGTGPNPNIGGNDLVLVNAPAFALLDDAVLANYFVDSFDILSGQPVGDNHTAIGLTVVSLLGGGGPLTATVFDKNEVVIGSWDVAGGGPEQFLGILAPDTIGRVNIYDQSGGAEGITFVEVYVGGEPPSEGAFLDIKPGSCPNAFNPRSRGKLPVSLLGTDDFDVSQVDISSLQISRADGVGGSVGPNEGPPGPHTVIADTGTPFDGELCECHELMGDGIDDLSMKFITQDVVDALELDDVPGGTALELCVSGTLLDGTPFEACDCVVFVPVSEGSAPVSARRAPDIIEKSDESSDDATGF